MLMVLLPAAVQGQVAVGGWTLYTPFSGVSDMVETGEYVYYLSAGSLYRIDKETTEVSALNVSNSLNDSAITGIFGDKNAKSVIVAYESGNMDRLYDNGRQVNIPDIKDVTVTGSHQVSDIAFGKEHYYVATAFGLVTYDDSKNEVRESAFTPESVSMVVTFGNSVGILLDRILYLASQDDQLTSFDKFFTTNYTIRDGWQSLEGFGDNGVLGILGNKLYTLTVDVDNKNVLKQEVKANNSTASVTNLFPKVGKIGPDAAYAVYKNGIAKFDGNGYEFISLPRADAATCQLLYKNTLDDVWVGDTNGVRMLDYTNASSPSVIHDNITGSSMTVPAVHNLHVGASGNIYISNLGEKISVGIDHNYSKMRINVIEDGKIRDITPPDMTIDNPYSASKTAPHYLHYHLSVYEDPTEARAYYVGSFMEGFHRFKGNTETHKYYTYNTPFYSSDGWSFCGLQTLVDKHGNLWAHTTAYGKPGGDTPRFFVLPASKRLSTDITASDWKQIVIPGYIKDTRDPLGIVCKHSDFLIFSDGFYSTQMELFNTKGTADLSDDVTIYVHEYIDQDGKTFSLNHITALCEDNNGRVWVGTSNGVIELAELSTINPVTANINRIKVPRNDGTNLADYLLEGITVTGISVDNANRKWISTLTSGVYLVSENGDEILENFTTDNSILPSNTVYAVACDPNSNKVYFGTASGLVEYSSTSAPGSDNYDNVYAYPNPVRPDYSGWITVTGLMDNSLVKIADAAGNVFHQGRSDGGMFTWDGCNSAGERVKTGVYYVFASQNQNGTSACVTKIMVIN